MSGGASVPLAALAIYFHNAPLKILFACLTAFAVVGACYQVWLDSVSALQKTIGERDNEIAKRSAEIEKLKHRDYDEEHRRLAERKVNALSEESKDLVYFLLHHGEMEADELKRHCQNPAYYDSAVQRASLERLVLGTQRGNVGRASVAYFWKVNPQFENVLRDLLGKRENPRYFL
jgi:hypothetical protein